MTRVRKTQEPLDRTQSEPSSSPTELSEHDQRLVNAHTTLNLIGAQLAEINKALARIAGELKELHDLLPGEQNGTV